MKGWCSSTGEAETEKLRTWAGDLAGKTQGVVAVVNRIDVPTPSAWDFSSGQSALAGLWHDTVRFIPIFLLGLLILALSALAGWFTARRARKSLGRRVPSKLLRGVLAWGLGTLVFLVGTYVVLRVAGLAQLALTLVGGTGLLGLALGIAFRDITENFLASIFLSVQRPFETGDLVEVDGDHRLRAAAQRAHHHADDARRQPRAGPQLHRLQEHPLATTRRTRTGASRSSSASATTTRSTRRRRWRARCWRTIPPCSTTPSPGCWRTTSARRR